MSNFNKPHLTFQEQLDLLRSRGLQITNEKAALKSLRRIGYYRLSGYWYPFRELIVEKNAQRKAIPPQRSNSFQPGAKFCDAVDLYVFDKRLRLLLLDAIERIEVAVRVDIAYLLGRYDRFAYIKPEFLHGQFVKKINGKTGITNHEKWLSNFTQLINRSKEDFVIHYKSRYGLPLPIWVAIELWDFGMLSKFFQGMRVKDKIYISQQYKISNWQIMESWLRCMNYIRNCVAHHNRLWNRNLLEQPKLPLRGEMRSFDPLYRNSNVQSRIYIILCIISHFIQNINAQSSWQKRMCELLNSFPKTPLANLEHMGLPTDWIQHDFWKSKNELLHNKKIITELHEAY